jgi:hypothetical protein
LLSLLFLGGANGGEKGDKQNECGGSQSHTSARSYGMNGKSYAFEASNAKLREQIFACDQFA